MSSRNNSIPAPARLSQWFSSARMSRYDGHPSPEALYLWNTHLTKAYLEDIEHLEVLLRKCINNALTSRYGEKWFDNGRLAFSNEAEKSIRKAKKRVGARDAPPGKIIAELSFDFWRFLISSHYQANIWPQIEKALKVKPDNRKQFEGVLVIAYHMRNRCSHHESIVHQHDIRDEIAHLDTVENAIQMVAHFIDPQAATWIRANSRVSALRAQRP